ncbi:MAG TPA: MOSC domain-containing protein, partial [Stenomitos sp.]
MSLVQSLQVGMPRTFGDPEATRPEDRSWTSGIVKEPVDGPLWLATTQLEGDGQADRVHHGGPDMAVLAYSAEHYPLWRAELGLDLPHGAFGENLTVTGLSEAVVCLGDLYQLGDAIVQVSQPRSPCWKLARRWGMPDLVARVQKTGRTGWYLRVLKEGHVAPNQEMALLERPYPQWTIERVSRAAFGGTPDPTAAELAACPALSGTWRERIA